MKMHFLGAYRRRGSGCPLNAAGTQNYGELRFAAGELLSLAEARIHC
jgi:hypothetical protein